MNWRKGRDPTPPPPVQAPEYLWFSNHEIMFAESEGLGETPSPLLPQMKKMFRITYYLNAGFGGQITPLPPSPFSKQVFIKIMCLRDADDSSDRSRFPWGIHPPIPRGTNWQGKSWKTQCDSWFQIEKVTNTSCLRCPIEKLKNTKLFKDVK